MTRMKYQTARLFRVHGKVMTIFMFIWQDWDPNDKCMTVARYHNGVLSECRIRMRETARSQWKRLLAADYRYAGGHPQTATYFRVSPKVSCLPRVPDRL